MTQDERWNKRTPIKYRSNGVLFWKIAKIVQISGIKLVDIKF